MGSLRGLACGAEWLCLHEQVVKKTLGWQCQHGDSSGKKLFTNQATRTCRNKCPQSGLRHCLQGVGEKLGSLQACVPGDLWEMGGSLGRLYVKFSSLCLQKRQSRWSEPQQGRETSFICTMLSSGSRQCC